MVCDLHLLTYWSHNATIAPIEYLDLAGSHGLRAIAFTDRLNIDGLEEMQRAAMGYAGKIKVIYGAELPVRAGRRIVDLLCYGLNKQKVAELSALFMSYSIWHREHARELFNLLAQHGYVLSDSARADILRGYRPSAVLDKQGYGTLLRESVVSEYFIKCGLITDHRMFKEIEKRLIDEYGLPPYLEAGSVVSALREQGCVVILARPYKYVGMNVDLLSELIDLCGFQGLECVHPDVPEVASRFYAKYCVQRNLLRTAGSGSRIDDDLEQRFGRYGGEVIWLEQLLERIGF